MVKLVAFEGNDEKQNMFPASNCWQTFTVPNFKNTINICEPVIAMTNESALKNREARNEKNKHDILQDFVQNNNLHYLHFVVHSLLSKTSIMCFSNK